MYLLTVGSTVIFALFIAWVISMADAGQSCIFFDLVKIVPYGDKIGHFLLFGLLALGTNVVLKLRGIRAGSITVPYGAILIFCIVVLEELSQYFIPARTLDISDLMADLTGIVVFSIISCSHYPRSLIDKSLRY